MVMNRRLISMATAAAMALGTTTAPAFAQGWNRGGGGWHGGGGGWHGGGGGWHHPSLPVRGGAAVQGALIVDVWGDALGTEATTSFMAAFQQRTGHAASSVAAEAYDAATLLAAARQAIERSPDPRTALAHQLARARIDDGACGPASIGPDGELVRDATVLEVQGDSLVMAP